MAGETLVQFGMDASPFLNVSDAVDAKLRELNDSIGIITGGGRSFNEVTGQMIQKLTGLTKAGDSFAVSLKEIDGVATVTSASINGIKNVTSDLQQELGVDAGVLGRKITDGLRTELKLDEVFANDVRLVDKEFQKLQRVIQSNLATIRQTNPSLFNASGDPAKVFDRVVKPATSGKTLTQTEGRGEAMTKVTIAAREFGDALLKAKMRQEGITAEASKTALAEREIVRVLENSVQQADLLRARFDRQTRSLANTNIEEAKLALSLKERSDLPLIPASDKAQENVRKAQEALQKFSSSGQASFDAVTEASKRAATAMRAQTDPLTEAEKKVLALRDAVEKSQQEVVTSTRKAVNGIVQANEARIKQQMNADATALAGSKRLTRELDAASAKRIQAADQVRAAAASLEAVKQAARDKTAAQQKAQTDELIKQIQKEVEAARAGINQRVKQRETLEKQLTAATDTQVQARIKLELDRNQDKLNKLKAQEQSRIGSLKFVQGDTPQFQAKRAQGIAQETIRQEAVRAKAAIASAQKVADEQTRIARKAAKDLAQIKKDNAKVIAGIDKFNKDAAKARAKVVLANVKANAKLAKEIARDIEKAREKASKEALARIEARRKASNERMLALQKDFARRTREGIATGVAARLGPRNLGGSVEAREQARRLRDELLQLARTADVPARRFKALVDGVVGGFRVLADNPAEKAVRANLIKIVDGFQNVEAASKKATQTQLRDAERVRQGLAAASGLTKAAKLPTNVKPADSARVQAAIIEVQNQVEKLGISGKRVVTIFQQLQQGVRPTITATERNVVKSLRRVVTSLDSAKKNVKGFSDGFLLSWQSMGRLVAIQQLHRGVALVSNALREGAASALLFGQTVARIQTILKEGDQNTRAWGDSIVDISSKFGVGLQDVAEGVFDAVSNQIVNTTQDVELFGETVGKLARVTGSSFEATGNLIAGLLNSFQLGLGDLEKVASKLFRAVDLGKFTIEEIAEQIGRAAPTANLLGIEMEELLGFLASLTIQGRKANTSLTLIRNIMAKLLKPTEAMTALMNKMGFETGNAAIEALGAEEFFSRLAKFGVGELVKAFSDLRAVEGIIALVADEKNFDKLTKNIEAIGNAAEEFQREAGKFFKDPFVALANEGNKVKNFFQNEFGRGIIKTISEINTSVGGFTELLKGVTTQIEGTPVLSILGGVGNAIASMTGAVTDANNAFNILFTVVEVGLNVMIARYAILFAAAIKQKIVTSEWTELFKSFKFHGANNIQAATAATVNLTSALAKATIVVAAITIGMELVAGSIRSADAEADRFAERMRKGFKADSEEAVEAVTAKFETLTEDLKKSSAQILEFFAVVVRSSKVAQGELGNATTALQSLIKERFKEAVRSAEESIRDLRNNLKKIASNIKESQDEITKINKEAVRDRLKALIGFAAIDDKIATSAIAAERKRLEKTIKEFDKVINSSEKRIKNLLMEEAGQQFDFDQPFGTAERQFESLIRKAEDFQRRAAVALTLGDQKEAANLFGQSEEGIEAAQESLKEQIKEQKDIVKKAAAEQEKLAKQSRDDRIKGEGGASVRDRINERKKLQEQAQAAIRREGELTQLLVRIEQERRDVVKDQINAEKELQQVKRQEKEEALAALASLKRADIARESEVGKLREKEFLRLQQLGLKARSGGQFDIGATALESQKGLLEQVRAQQLASLAVARQAKDLESIEKFNQQIFETDRRLLDLVHDRTTLEQARQEALQVEQKDIGKVLVTEQDRLTQAREIARSVNNIKINADASLAELDKIEARMIQLGQNFTKQVGDRFKDELGRSLDIAGVIAGGFDVVKGIQDNLVKIPIDVAAQLSLAGVEAKSLEDASVQLSNKLRRVKSDLKEIATLTQQATGQQFLTTGELEQQSILLRRQLSLSATAINAGTASGVLGGAGFEEEGLFKSLFGDKFISGLSEGPALLKTGFAEVKQSLIALADQGILPTDDRVKILLTRFEELSEAAIKLDELALGTNTERLTTILAKFGTELRGSIVARSTLAALAPQQAKLEEELELINSLGPSLRAARDIQAERLEEQRKLNRDIEEELRLRALGQGASEFDARKRGATDKRRSDASSDKVTKIDLKFDINGVQDPRALTDMIITRIKRETRLATNSL